MKGAKPNPGLLKWQLHAHFRCQTGICRVFLPLWVVSYRVPMYHSVDMDLATNYSTINSRCQ